MTDIGVRRLARNAIGDRYVSTAVSALCKYLYLSYNRQIAVFSVSYIRVSSTSPIEDSV
jgi:hypothetical protein